VPSLHSWLVERIKTFRLHQNEPNEYEKYLLRNVIDFTAWICIFRPKATRAHMRSGDAACGRDIKDKTMQIDSRILFIRTANKVETHGRNESL
jgi:hypothetical protein